MHDHSQLEVLVLGVRSIVLSEDADAVRDHGVRIVTHADPVAALISLRDLSPDVVVVPADLPGIEAPLVVAAITQEAETPCLVVWGAGQDSHENVWRSIEAGAVGLLPHEVDIEELLSVLSLARVTTHSSPRIRVGELDVDLPAMAIRRGDQRADLSTVQAVLVEHLARRSPRYISGEELMALLGYDGRRNALKQAIAGLRRKLEPLNLPWDVLQYSNAYAGYRLVGDESTASA